MTLHGKEFDITVVNGQIQVSEEATALIEEARRLDLRMKRNEIQMKMFRESLMKAMKENGIKTFENDSVRVTYTPEHMANKLDTKALKEAHPRICEQFTKESTVSDSIRLSFKE